jgi:hypothetical protein
MTLVRMTSTQMIFLEMVSDRWLVSDDPVGEEAGC